VSNNLDKSVENNGDNEQSTTPSDEFLLAGNNSAAFQQQILLAQMQKNEIQDDEIDLKQLWRAMWAGKFTIIIISFIFAVASIYFAKSKPNVYKATAILTPASSEGGAGGLSALASQFGGLANMAGINLGSGGSNKTDLALEIIKSRSFIEKFIAKHDLLVPLMAAEKWDKATDNLIINEKLYDQSSNKWIGEVKAPNKAGPSSWQAFIKFSSLLSVSQIKNKTIVIIELEYFSPAMAQQWLNWLIADVNEFMRDQDQKEAKDSIDYLTEQLKHIHVTTMETVFYQLIEEQTKNMMLTKVKAEYVLKIIDPAQVPDIKSSPKRGLIVVLGTILGGILSVIIVLIRYFSSKESKK